MLLLKSIDSYIAENKIEGDSESIMSDMRYLCKSSSLITEALQKGCDVLQMPNGDIVITEVKTVTFQYSWDDKKGKLVRVQAGSRPKKLRKKASQEEVSEEDLEDSYELDQCA